MGEAGIKERKGKMEIANKMGSGKKIYKKRKKREGIADETVKRSKKERVSLLSWLVGDGVAAVMLDPARTTLVWKSLYVTARATLVPSDNPGLSYPYTFAVFRCTTVPKTLPRTAASTGNGHGKQ